MSRLLSLALAAAGLIAAAPVHAAGTIAGVTFNVDIVIDDGLGGTSAIGPFSAVANAIDDNYFSNADLNEYFIEPVSGIEYNIRINWVDADSVDIFINGFGGASLDQLSITLSGLAFKDGAVPVPIVGAAFNRPTSNVDEYQAGPSLGNPSVTFSAQSMTAAYGHFESALIADGPRLRFDLQTAAVPEPGTYALMLAGLGGVALARRRRQPRDLANAAMRS